MDKACAVLCFNVTLMPRERRYFQGQHAFLGIGKQLHLQMQIRAWRLVNRLF